MQRRVARRSARGRPRAVEKTHGAPVGRLIQAAPVRHGVGVATLTLHNLGGLREIAPSGLLVQNRWALPHVGRDLALSGGAGMTFDCKPAAILAAGCYASPFHALPAAGDDRILPVWLSIMNRD